jgi:hypothetical protein
VQEPVTCRNRNFTEEKNRLKVMLEDAEMNLTGCEHHPVLPRAPFILSPSSAANVFEHENTHNTFSKIWRMTGSCTKPIKRSNKTFRE